MFEFLSQRYWFWQIYKKKTHSCTLKRYNIWFKLYFKVNIVFCIISKIYNLHKKNLNIFTIHIFGLRCIFVTECHFYTIQDDNIVITRDICSFPKTSLNSKHLRKKRHEMFDLEKIWYWTCIRSILDPDPYIKKAHIQYAYSILG